ncbi:arabinosyltransferase domain-containing protein [Saccharomonospora xinjiangensis]|uniref:PMT family glycosyltransferase, 4-amino-4-deoxy-L-arabinose transferase n=1 Tax=Saccharomonospora xinjiangensis XJ-54 TaxID=882086 RepID=I0V1Z7_9PSEU|nr:arabinosyltransferase domain-containing protein [Saccharomonospora xinjiangensis]EID54150.1 PMT family glycosyltransferase, 4-amino-4-deoxy-L-arabinose transferase [Saccharomonospora xinjiangensis XJ-54]
MTFRTWLITICALLATVSAGLFVLAPVDAQPSRYEWPHAGVTDGVSRVLPLLPYEPHRLDVTFGCSDANTISDGLLLSTTSTRETPVGNRMGAGLAVHVESGAVTVDVGGQRVLTSDVGRDCEWSISSGPHGTVVSLDGDPVARTGTTPVVSGMFTEAASQTDLRVTVVPDTRFESTPGPIRGVLAAVALVSAAAMFVLLARNRSTRARRVRLLPQGWWRPRWPDAVVAGALAGWLVVGAPTVDDGYIVTMLKAEGDSGFIGNYFRWFNAPEAPFSWFYELYRGFADASDAVWWLRLPSVLLGLLGWLLVDRLLLPRLARRPGALVRFGAAGAFALWYVQFGVGLRPEPWVMIGTVVVFLLVERAVALRSLTALAVAVLAAGLTVAVTPTGVLALAPFVAASGGLWRLLRRHGPVLVPVALGACATPLLVMFADQSLAAVAYSTEVRTAIGPAFGVSDEPMRYADLLSPVQGGLNRRMPLVLLWLSMLVLALLLLTRRAAGLARRPTLRALLVALLFFVALAFTPTKYTHHFGAIGGIAAVLFAAVVHTVRSGALRRPVERSLFVVAVAATAAYALNAPLRWWFVADLGVPWSREQPDVGGIDLAGVVLVGGLALAVAGLLGAWRRLPSPAWLLPALAVGTVVLELVSMAYPLHSRAGTYSVARSTLASFSGSCGIEDWLDVEPDVRAGLLPAEQGEGSGHGFKRNAGYPGDTPPPAPYGTDDAPVWGSGGDAASWTSPWFPLPAGAGAPGSPPLVVPVVGRGAVSATVQFSRDGGGDGGDTVSREVRLRVGEGTWREARLDPRDAERVRVVAVDRREGDGWLAVGLPRLPKVVPVTEYVPASRPVALDWVNAFFLPCRQPAAVAHGVTQPVTHLFATGPDSRWLTGMSYAPESGGPYAPLLDVAELVAVPTYLRGDKLREPISVFRFDYVAPPLESLPR